MEVFERLWRVLLLLIAWLRCAHTYIDFYVDSRQTEILYGVKTEGIFYIENGVVNQYAMTFQDQVKFTKVSLSSCTLKCNVIVKKNRCTLSKMPLEMSVRSCRVKQFNKGSTKEGVSAQEVSKGFEMPWDLGGKVLYSIMDKKVTYIARECTKYMCTYEYT